MENTFLGLRTVIYKVPDFRKATDWYSQVLNAKPYFDEPFYVGFNAAGYELGLQPSQNQHDTLTDTIAVYWGVADVSNAYQRLLILGAQSHEEPTEVGGGIVVATVKDPWGNLFGIIYNPHFQLL